MNAIATPRSLTPQQAKLRLKSLGKTVPQFCKEHGLDVQAAYDVLNGRQTGNRGKSHQAAVALGIKARRSEPGPLTEIEARALAIAEAAAQSLVQLGLARSQITVKTLTLQPLLEVPPSPVLAPLGGACIWTLQCHSGILRCHVAAFQGCLLRWIENLGHPDLLLENEHEQPRESLED